MMTRMRSFFIVIATLLFLPLMSGCEDFLNVNDNPNAPGSTNLGLRHKFPAALLSTAIQESDQMNIIGGFWGGYWGTNSDGSNQYYDLKTYNGPSIRNQRDGIPVWEESFNNLLYYELIKSEADEKNDLFYSGAAKIMQGWHFLRLVDFYNNIPFDDALQGTSNPTPSYEDGEQVYRKSIDLISLGIEEVKTSANLSGGREDDILFEGNRVMWARFGNTIKLRALIRQSETGNDSYIQTEIDKIMAEGSGFLSEGETVTVNPGYSSSQPNNFYTKFYRDQGGSTTSVHHYIRPTEFLIEQYQTRNDPRIRQLYIAIDGEFNGVIFGNENTSDPRYHPENTSAFLGPEENGHRPAGIFKSPEQPNILFSSFESLFLQAEAAERGWISESADRLYKSAILESFRQTEIDESLLDEYLNQESVIYQTAPDKIERIIGQKWLALNSISNIEAWNDYRRLGWPEFPNSAASGIGQNERPLRFMYPESERSTNNENASKQGNDEMTVSPVWWDQ